MFSGPMLWWVLRKALRSEEPALGKLGTNKHHCLRKQLVCRPVGGRAKIRRKGRGMKREKRRHFGEEVTQGLDLVR